MSNRNARVAAAVLAVVLMGASAGAEAMRCGNRLISEGDPTAKVRALCGEPSQISESSAVRRVPVIYRGPIRPRGPYHYPPVHAYEEVSLERWVYNFGPQRFMRELQIQDGRVTRIERLGYGYREDW